MCPWKPTTDLEPYDVLAREHRLIERVLFPAIDAKSFSSYRAKVDHHILPALGGFKVRKLHRGTIKTFLAEKQASGLSVDSVRLIDAALRGC